MRAYAAGPRPPLRHATRVTAVLGALILCISSCVDLSEPPWWEGPIDNGGQDTGFTARVMGQGCDECASIPLGQPGACPDFQNPPADALRLHFIDVGQGDAIFVQTPTGENLSLIHISEPTRPY